MPLPDTVYPSSGCPIWFVGSSSIERWRTIDRDIPGWQVHRRGVGGALIDQIAARLSATASHPAPRAIVLYAGDNDIHGGASGRIAAGAMLRVVLEAQYRWPDILIVVLGLKPSPNRWNERAEQLRYNRILMQFAATRKGLFVLPHYAGLLRDGVPDPALFVDGVHMNDEGYRRWSQGVRDIIAARLPDPASCSRPGA